MQVSKQVDQAGRQAGAFQLLEYQTDVRRCWFDKNQAHCNDRTLPTQMHWRHRAWFNARGNHNGRLAGCKGCRSCSRSVASKGKAGARAGIDLPQDTKARHYTKSEACPKSTVSLS